MVPISHRLKTSMKQPRILFLTSGARIPSTRYRIAPYIPRLREQGIVCDVRHSFPPKYHRISWLGWRLSHLLRKLCRLKDWCRTFVVPCDVIVIERELFDDPSSWMERIFRSRCKRLILDVDDAIFLRYPEKFPLLCRLSDLVIVGNSFLATACESDAREIKIIPTAIELKEYLPSGRTTRNQPAVVGWIGTETNIPQLKLILPALREVSQNIPLVLRVISSSARPFSELDLEGIELEFQEWSADTAIDDIREFDIGVMPLVDEPWERYKCGFKLLQYMAAGVPAIASPVGVNSQIIQSGVNGILAENTADWISALQKLLTDEDCAHQMAATACKTVEEHYSVGGWTDPFIQAVIGER